MSEERRELAVGARLGPYEIVAPLGAGGMGLVFCARDTRLGREVAIKVLPDTLAADEMLLKRFEQESRVLAALSHPNVLAVYDVGSTDGRHYLVTELLAGVTLKDHLAHAPRRWAELYNLAAQLAAGLAAIHERGVVHRDLKPANIFVTNDGRVKLIDFGLARSEAGGDLTKSGTFMGTPGYMAPEQLRSAAVDPRADQFAFGVVLYEMLTGETAFEGEAPMDRALATMSREPRQLAALGAGPGAPLFALVRRCIEKDPAARHATMREVASALSALRQVFEEVGSVGGDSRALATPAPEAGALDATHLSGGKGGAGAPVGPSSARARVVALAIAALLGVGAAILLAFLRGRVDASVLATGIDAGTAPVFATATRPAPLAEFHEVLRLTTERKWAVEVPALEYESSPLGDGGRAMDLVLVVARSGFVVGATGGILRGIPNEADGAMDFAALHTTLEEVKHTYPAETRLVVVCDRAAARDGCDLARISAAEGRGGPLFPEQWLVEGEIPQGVLGSDAVGFEVHFTTEGMPVRRLTAESLARLKAKYPGAVPWRRPGEPAFAPSIEAPRTALPTDRLGALNLEAEKLREQALELEAAGQATPDATAGAWCRLSKLESAYKTAATTACDAWRGYAATVKTLSRSLDVDLARLTAYLALRHTATDDKIAAGDSFLRTYWPLKADPRVKKVAAERAALIRGKMPAPKAFYVLERSDLGLPAVEDQPALAEKASVSQQLSALARDRMKALAELEARFKAADGGGGIAAQVAYDRQRAATASDYERRLEVLERKEREARQAAITSLEHAPPHALVLLTLAELQYEKAYEARAEARGWSERTEWLGADAPKRVDPKTHFAAIVQLARRVIREFPDDALVPTAWYLLGYVLETQEKYDDAREAYTQLAVRFPNSRFTQEVTLRRAELYFDSAPASGPAARASLTKAALAYEQVSRDLSWKFVDMALYKLGWTGWRLEDNARARRGFQAIVMLHEGKVVVDGRTIAEHSELAAEAKVMLGLLDQLDFNPQR